MIGAVIVTHGQLANELVSAAEMIVGEINHITAVSIGWHDDVDVASEEIERAIQRMDTGSGVLLLTDMFGGTPTNIAGAGGSGDRREPADGDQARHPGGRRNAARAGAPRPRPGSTADPSRQRHTHTKEEVKKNCELRI